jgi:mitogen-activated protein kinase kinase
MAQVSTHDSPDSMPATPDEYLDRDGLSSPASPGSADSSEASTPLEAPLSDGAKDLPKRVPSLRTVSDPQNMNPTSTAIGILSNARRPPVVASVIMGGASNEALMRAKALVQQRKGLNVSSPSGSSPVSPMGNSPINMLPGGIPANLRLGSIRPLPGNMAKSAPVIPTGKGSLAARRGGMKLDLGSAGQSPSGGGTPKLSDLGPVKRQDSKMDDFKRYIDTEKGWVTFEGAATITRTGVNFANGQTFSISLDEIEVLDELGKGNYGTVYKVRHAKPKVPRFGPGVSGFRKQPILNHTISDPLPVRTDEDSANSSPVTPVSGRANGTTGAIMAMKEMRLELEESKFTTILKELVILHECVSPYIIDFYGAFFQEGAVYICIEYMDGGSIDKLYSGGIPENILRKITYSTIMGLKSLKDEHNIIHRDVKPTNILVNTKGQVKICDFGVSGNLVASIAKTNIGCQSYMAPERISGGGFAQGADGTYSVQSDIWSLGLTIIECAMGRYPYPPEVSSTIFSQLSVSHDLFCE